MPEPTRTSPSGTTSLIDLALISNLSMLSSCSVIPPLSTSDHKGVKLSLKWRTCNRRRTKRRKVWRYKQADFESANFILSSVDWANLLSQSEEIDEMWGIWKDKFMSVMEQYIPQATLPEKRNLPWLNKELAKSMRAGNLAYKRAKQTKNPKHWNTYKQKRNSVANKLKQAKRKYFTQFSPSNPKLFWKTVKILTKDDTRIPFLKDESGEIISEDMTTASTLNNFFSDCFNLSVPPLSECDKHIFSEVNSRECPSEFLCTDEEVLDLLLTLDTTKANGPDNVSATMLKATVHSIAGGITFIFNKSIKLGSLPREWKLSAVNPIPKGKEKNKPSNYRPISLLPVLNKLLERHMFKLILSHVESAFPLAS